jgi:hypothetical protein
MLTMQQTRLAFHTDECHAIATVFPSSLNSGVSKSATDLQLKPQSNERLYISSSTSAHQHYCQFWHSSFGGDCVRLLFAFNLCCSAIRLSCRHLPFVTTLQQHTETGGHKLAQGWATSEGVSTA